MFSAEAEASSLILVKYGDAVGVPRGVIRGVVLFDPSPANTGEKRPSVDRRASLVLFEEPRL